MASIEALEQAGSLAAVSELIRSAGWKQFLASLAKRTDAADDIQRLRRAVAETRYRLSPESASPELQSLRDQAYRDPNVTAAQTLALLEKMDSVRATLPLPPHERLFAQLEASVEQMVAVSRSDVGQGGDGRRALSQFTEFAGQQHIPGASTDQHGNADGARYDLGRDGAFSGQNVHVLQLYTEAAFDFSLPTKAFARKGFGVQRRTEPGSPDSLRQWLSDAQQLWVISHSRSFLTKEHIDVIRAFWKRGGALYIWGDNAPYYLDANALLKGLFAEELSMTGDTPGGKVVHALGPDAKGVVTGFVPHLVTTGMENLFEGITVASLKGEIAAKYSFIPLLYGSAGNLITVVRDPTPETGAIMVDAAFTRLYCQWDEAGSARYVCNAACYLAAVSLTDDSSDVPSETAPANP